MREFRDKVAVITGAASGIGRAVAERCVVEGMRVVLADVEEDALVRAEAAMSDTGATVLAVPTDVSAASDVEALAQKTLSAFGAVHLVHNNAGVVLGGRIWENTVADWEWVIGVNMWGVIHGIRVFVPLMLEQGQPSHIVNTASMAGLTSGGNMAPYHVSKHGVESLRVIWTLTPASADQRPYHQGKRPVQMDVAPLGNGVHHMLHCRH